jgi:hypothetical protein
MAAGDAISDRGVRGHGERLGQLVAGGTDGNELLTTMTGTVLLALSAALVGGAVLAIVLIPGFSSWTVHVASLHHHH